MFEKLKQVFSVKEIRNKIIFVAVMLLLFKVISAIPVPGVDTAALANFMESNDMFGLLDIFAGGGLSSLSIAMLGVGPYITSSIIFQLLAMIIPALERMQKEEGEEGRKKLNQLTRIFTVPFAALQVYSMISLMNRGPVKLITDLSATNMISIVVAATAGTVLLMWIGELISEKGIGNGVSLIIFAGIVSRIPASIKQTLSVADSTQTISMLVFGAIAIVVIAGVVLITEGQRNIPVSYAKRIRGNRMYGGVTSHLPLRVNQAGVMPIIFAIAIMLFPGIIAQFLSNVSNTTIANVAASIAAFFNDKLVYAILYFVLVVAFTYFYTSITFDPKQISENVQRQGGFIPGIRPGKPTADYLKYIVNRITLTGALFLGVIAVLPNIVQAGTGIQTLTIGGTALLIVVSVVIETVKQIDSQLVMRDYEGI